jgi:hypothetical protein
MRPSYLTTLSIIILSVSGSRPGGRTQNIMAGNSLRREEHIQREMQVLVWGASRSDLNASSACLQRCVHGLFLCAAAAMSSSVLCGQTAKHILGEAKHASHIAFAHDSVMQLVSGLLVPLVLP